MQFNVAVIILAMIVLTVIMSAIAYFVGARGFKQSLPGFLVRYVAVLGILFLIEYAFIELLPFVHASLCNFTAVIVGGILGLTGVEHSVSGSIIMPQEPYLSFEVTVACLGGLLFWAYIAMVLAESGMTIRQRLLGIVAGLSVLFAFNLFRIIISIYIEEQTGVYIHDYFYLFNMVFVLLVWAAYVRILIVRAAQTPLTGRPVPA